MAAPLSFRRCLGGVLLPLDDRRELARAQELTKRLASSLLWDQVTRLDPSVVPRMQPEVQPAFALTAHRDMVRPAVRIVGCEVDKALVVSHQEVGAVAMGLDGDSRRALTLGLSMIDETIQAIDRLDVHGGFSFGPHAADHRPSPPPPNDPIRRALLRSTARFASSRFPHVLLFSLQSDGCFAGYRPTPQPWSLRSASREEEHVEP